MIKRRLVSPIGQAVHSMYHNDLSGGISMNYDGWMADEDMMMAYDGMYDPYFYRNDGYFDPRFHRDFRFRRFHPRFRHFRHRRYW